MQTFSYIFMKILENRPERYDAGINILSGGHAKKIRQQIIQNYVKPSLTMLDIGCGTGSLIIEAANAGARATGVDISDEMLSVARKRITRNGLADSITIHNAGVVEVSSLFEESSFDLIVSTLVFSELYSEERALVLEQIKKLLKPNGTLVIAVEVQPKKLIKRIVHFLVRLPLVVLTYLIAQTGTKPFTRISEEITEAGLKIISEERSFLDSFTIISAKKQGKSIEDKNVLPQAKSPDADFSIIKSIWDFIGRWFPNPVEPGLRIIGKPDRKSPVILTTNFHLTVRRVEKALKDENIYLLVAPANGINVWCASCGGEFNTHSAITVIKTSRINERVDHHRLILPQFSAPGVDRKLLKKETGCKAIFGTAYARDIPFFLRDTKSVFEHNKADFSLFFRLEMLLSMNFMVWILFSLIILLIKPILFLPLSGFYWGAGLILYAGFSFIPGKSGWLKASILSFIEVIAIAIYSTLKLHITIFNHWGIMITVTVITLWLGFDLKGIVVGEPSEAEWLLEKLKISSFGKFFSSRAATSGKIYQEINKCNNCRICLIVCPKDVYGIENKKEIRIKKASECFACRACITQCEQNALSLTNL